MYPILWTDRKEGDVKNWYTTAFSTDAKSHTNGFVNFSDCIAQFTLFHQEISYASSFTMNHHTYMQKCGHKFC